MSPRPAAPVEPFLRRNLVRVSPRSDHGSCAIYAVHLDDRAVDANRVARAGYIAMPLLFTAKHLDPPFVLCDQHVLAKRSDLLVELKLPISIVALGRLREDLDDDDRIGHGLAQGDRKSTRLNSSHVAISYAVFCLKKKK